MIYVLKNTSLALISMCCTLLLCEAGVRLFVEVNIEPHSKNLYIADPDVGYRNNPGFKTTLDTEHGISNIQFNKQSIRDYKDYGQKDSVTFRILLLGDSQTFNGAIPLHLTYGKVLEKLLNDQSDSLKFEVLNAGVSGYSTANEAAFLAKFGPELFPDMVIVGFYENDLIENRGGVAQKTVKDGYLLGQMKEVTGNPFILPYWLKKFLRTYSRLYFFTISKWDRIKGRFSSPWKKTYSATPTKYVQENWDITYNYLNKIKKWSETNNCNYVIAYIPQALQIVDHVLISLNMDNEKFDRTIINKKLKAFCNEENIIFYDGYNDFNDSMLSEQLYLHADMHLSIKGNEVFGKGLYKFLNEKN